MTYTPRRYTPEVAVALDRDFRSGGAKPDLSDFEAPVDDDMGQDETAVELDLVRLLVDHALGLELSDNELDSWLASHLHYGLRIPRRLAGDRGFWAWLTIEAGGQYVLHRWLGKNPDDPDVVTEMRYTGDTLRNAFARLWWGAEMVRNGPSYADVKTVFNRVWTAEYALELRYSWYRPAAIAFARVAEGTDGESPLSTEEMKKLSVRINSYLSLKALEALGLHEEPDEEPDMSWWGRRPPLNEIISADELRGPRDGFTGEEAIAALSEWYKSLL